MKAAKTLTESLENMHEVATQGSVNTRHGVERCIRYAFELA